MTFSLCRFHSGTLETSGPGLYLSNTPVDTGRISAAYNPAACKVVHMELQAALSCRCGKRADTLRSAMYASHDRSGVSDRTRMLFRPGRTWGTTGISTLVLSGFYGILQGCRRFVKWEFHWLPSHSSGSVFCRNL
jgi:hypothetical protein